jgi:hypothetical protein
MSDLKDKIQLAEQKRILANQNTTNQLPVQLVTMNAATIFQSEQKLGDADDLESIEQKQEPGPVDESESTAMTADQLRIRELEQQLELTNKQLAETNKQIAEEKEMNKLTNKQLAEEKEMNKLTNKQLAEEKEKTKLITKQIAEEKEKIKYLHFLSEPLPRLGEKPRYYGTSHSASQHAECGYRMCPDSFSLLSCPSELKNRQSRVFGESSIGQAVLNYGSESDIVRFVSLFLKDLINAGKFAFERFTEVGIQEIRPNICILTQGKRPIGVVEVKKPEVNRTSGPSSLLAPTVLGELMDQMLLLQGFYGSGPIIGILTTYEEWVFAWFPEDSDHFQTTFERSDEPLQAFVTPTPTPAKGNGDLEDKENSPLGNTPSQQHSGGWEHRIEVEDCDLSCEVEGEVTETGLSDRVLYLSNVINAYEGYGDLLNHLYTAFCRMAQVRLSHSVPSTRRCSFVLHLVNDQHPSNPMSWVPRVTSLESLTRDRFPNANITKLMAVEDLGRGGSGRAWLMCTLSENPSICVLKFRNKMALSKEKIKEEQRWWDEVYGKEFPTRADNWSGSWALMMPHFSAIPLELRLSFIDRIRALLVEKFQGKGLVHPDVAWRNIGMYVTPQGEECPVLFDLCDLQRYDRSNQAHRNWIETAISALLESAPLPRRAKQWSC